MPNNFPQSIRTFSIRSGGNDLGSFRPQSLTRRCSSLAQAANGVVITANDPASSLFISNCTFQYTYSNELGTSNGLGGAVYARGSLYIENSTFVHNSFYKQTNQSGEDFVDMMGSSSSYLVDLFPNCTGPRSWIQDSICDSGEQDGRRHTSRAQ